MIELSRFRCCVLWVCWGLSGCYDSGDAPLTLGDKSWVDENLTAVEILSGTQALVTSLSGSIYSTRNAAHSLRRVHADGAAALHDLAMADAASGWAVGDGKLLVTRDGGGTWQAQALPPEKADGQLRAVHAIDTEHAVAVGLGGLRLFTEDGGETWQDRSDALRAGEEHRSPSDASDASDASDSTIVARPHGEISEASLEADLYDVFCSAEPTPICISLGALGGTAYSLDLGKTWRAAWIASPALFDPIRMPAGAAELSPGAVARVKTLAESEILGREVAIRIEAVTSGSEIEDIGRERDPEALFDILEARAFDVVSALEEAGVSDERIEVRGAPAWGFEDLLDDDPEFLERYWHARSAREPGVYVSIFDRRPFRAGRFLPDGDADHEGKRRVVAVGHTGSIWRSLDGGRTWTAVQIDETCDLRAVAVTGDPARLIAIGARCGIWISTDAGQHWHTAVSTQGLPVLHDVTFNDLDVSADAALGLMVGESGAMFAIGSDGSVLRRIRVADP